METGINLFCYNDELCIEKQIELMLENGFGHTFVMGDNPKLESSLVDKVKRAGIVFDTLHAPFRGINDMWFQGEKGDETLKRLCDTVSKCADFDIPVAIMHLSSGKPAPVISDAGNSRFSRLMEFARKKNVTLAFENQRFVANIASVLEQHPDAGFCWDVGHEGCFTKGIKFMPLFGNRLTAVHIHDNHHLPDGDEHLIPYDGITDYEEVGKTLAGYDFAGTVMLEIFCSESENYKKLTPQEFYHRAGIGARKVAEQVEKFKNA